MSVNIEDLVPLTKPVNLGRGEVEVRGLGLGELVPFLIKHGDVLEPFMDSDLTPDFTGMIAKAPKIVGELIAMGIGADDPDVIHKIPLAAQVEILMTMWKISVPDPKEFAAKLSELLGTVKQLRK